MKAALDLAKKLYKGSHWHEIMTHVLEFPEFYEEVFVSRYFAIESQIECIMPYEAKSPLEEFTDDPEYAAHKELIDELQQILREIKLLDAAFFAKIQRVFRKVFKRNLIDNHVTKNTCVEVKGELQTLLLDPMMSPLTEYLSANTEKLAVVAPIYDKWINRECVDSVEQCDIDKIMYILKCYDYYATMHNNTGLAVDVETDYIEIAVKFAIPILFRQYGYDLAYLNWLLHEKHYPKLNIRYDNSPFTNSLVRENVHSLEMYNFELMGVIAKFCGCIYVRYHLEAFAEVDMQNENNRTALIACYESLCNEPQTIEYFTTVRKAIALLLGYTTSSRLSSHETTTYNELFPDSDTNASSSDSEETNHDLPQTSISFTFHASLQPQKKDKVLKEYDLITEELDKIAQQIKQLRNMESTTHNTREISILAEKFRSARLKYLRLIKRAPASYELGYVVNPALHHNLFANSDPFSLLNELYLTHLVGITTQMSIHQECAGTIGEAYRLLCTDQMKVLNNFMCSVCAVIQRKISVATTDEDKCQSIIDAIEWLEGRIEQSDMLKLNSSLQDRKTRLEQYDQQYTVARPHFCSDEISVTRSSPDRYCYAHDENDIRFVGQIFVLLDKWLHLQLTHIDPQYKYLLAEKYSREGLNSMSLADREKIAEKEVSKAINQLQRLSEHMPGIQDYVLGLKGGAEAASDFHMPSKARLAIL